MTNKTERNLRPRDQMTQQFPRIRQRLQSQTGIVDNNIVSILSAQCEQPVPVGCVILHQKETLSDSTKSKTKRHSNSTITVPLLSFCETRCDNNHFTAPNNAIFMYDNVCAIPTTSHTHTARDRSMPYIRIWNLRSYHIERMIKRQWPCDCWWIELIRNFTSFLIPQLYDIRCR